MALDFPSSPTNGQSYNGWIYNSAKSAWQTAATGVMMTVSTTAPSSPKVGDQWYNLNNGLRFTWVNDGTSSQWVQDYAPVANDSVYDTRITALETGVRTVPLGGTGAATLTGYVKGNGTSAFTAQTTPIPVADGGTGATTAAGARTNLSVPSIANPALTGIATINGQAVNAIDGRNNYIVGNTGTGTAANYYSVFSWTVTGQYTNFNARIAISGRGISEVNYEIHIEGEMGASSVWNTKMLRLYNQNAVPDGDTWVATFNNSTQTATLYFRRSGTDWNDRRAVIITNHTESATFAYSNSLYGTTQPTSDTTVVKTAADQLNILSGGTGATTGSGLVPIIPTSVSVGSGSGSVASDGTVTYSGATVATINGVFSATYDNYLITWYPSAMSVADYLYMRWSSGGTANTTSQYYGAGVYVQGTTVGAWSNSGSAQTFARVGYAQNDQNSQVIIEAAYPYNTAGKPHAFYRGSYAAGNHTTFHGSFIWSNFATFDGFTVGNETTGNSSGTIRIYGVRK